MRTWPLVGRQAELTAITTGFRTAGVAGMVIAGTAGAGKTRLAQAALEVLSGNDCRTEWVSATRAMASIPFGAVLGLLPGAPPANRMALLNRVAADLEQCGGRAKVVIGVDDAHLLDDGSAALIAHLAARQLAFLVVTLRTGEPVPDAVLGLWKDGTAHRIDLTGLPPTAVDRLLDHSLPGALEGYSRRLLHQAAAGNPLTLSELLRAGIADGVLRKHYGVWRWVGECRAGGRAAELIADRLRGVDPAVRPVLELVACGEPVPLTLLERLADNATIAAAEDSGMVVAERSGARIALRLAHPLYGEVLRSGLPSGRARMVWRRLVEAALALPMRRAGDALRAAVWQLEAGTVVRPEVLRLGARQAVDRSDLVLAERLARAARDTEPGTEADCLLAEILEYRGRSVEAVAILPEQPPPPGPARTQWAIARASTLYWGAGQLGPAEQVLDLAATGPGDDLVAATRAWIWLFDARCVDSLATARQVFDRPGAVDQARIWAAAVGSAAAGFLGRWADAAELHERGLALATACYTELPWGVTEIGYAACLSHLATGDLDRAWTVADHGYRAAIQEQLPVLPGSWAGFRGLVELAQGRPVTATVSLREAVAAIEHNDTFRFVRCCMAALAAATALTGDTAEATQWLARVDRLGNGSNRLFAPWIELDRAWTLAASGAVSEAVSSARQAAEFARATGLPTMEALACYDVVRLGGVVRQGGVIRRGDGELHRLSELAERLGTPFAVALAQAAAGHAGHDGDALGTAGAAFEALGHWLRAAEASAAASRAYRRAGRRSSAQVHAERAAALRTRCEGVRTPLLDAGIEGVLTVREREVVLLAVHHSSKQIAYRLGLSVRTVDNNLARAYAKLGVSGRAQLRALLGKALAPGESGDSLAGSGDNGAE